jgi:D-psicose/D-tagatose/L-ribulose 3-epimerase
MTLLVAHPLTWIPRWTLADGPRAIARAAACGFDAVVVPLRDPAQVDAAAIARACAAEGVLPFPAINHPPDADPAADDPAIAARGRDRLLHALALARDIGATRLGGLPHAAWGKAAGPVTPRGRAHAVATLAEAARQAATAGMVLTIEAVNRFENALVNTAAQAAALVAETGAENILLHLDTHHMLVEEQDSAAAVAAAAPRLGFLECSESHRGALGTGGVDLRGVIGAAIRAGYRGPIGFEAFSAAILDPALAAGFCVWRATYTDADQVARDAAALLRHLVAEARATEPPR